MTELITQPIHPRICAVQLNSNDCIESNLDTAYQHIVAAKDNNASCVILPETFAWIGPDKEAGQATEPAGAGIVQTFLSQTAKEQSVWLIGGSHRLKTANDDQRFTNTTLVFDPTGAQVARYDKIHLFDAEVNDGIAYRESDTFAAGDSLTIVDLGFARIGLSICYDIRFPALYQALRQNGADIIVVPAAFTIPTGKAHWQTLLRARAIENQVYIIAAAQTGTHSNGRKTWGQSLCIDPWGKVVSENVSTVGNIYCPFDAGKLNKVRNKMPVNNHHQPASYKLRQKND